VNKWIENKLPIKRLPSNLSGPNQPALLGSSHPDQGGRAIRIPRVRFTVQRMMIGTAIIAINLAAVSAILPTYREKWWNPGTGAIKAYKTMGSRRDGSTWLVAYNTLTGYPMRSVMVRPPTLQGLMRVWWPLAASGGISLTALITARCLRRGWPRDRPWLSVDSDPPEPE
jgi:hypothetical protein